MHPQIQFLLNHADSASPFTSPTGQAFLSVPLGTFSQQVYSVHSPRIRDWLVDAFFRVHQEPPTPYALRQTIRTLEARATCSQLRLAVDRRVAARGHPLHPDAIRIDLTNNAGEFVEITSQGWNVDTAPNAAFLRSRGYAELPAPQSSDACLLPPALHPATEADRLPLTTWLLNTLRPAGPHPILVLEGPPSSGKSTAARMLRNLIDPSTAPLLSLPHSEPELLAIAQHNWILAFDQTGPIRQPVSDTLCRLATGAVVRHREKGDQREHAVEELHRPIVITTTAGWNPSEALAERILTVKLAPLTAATRRPESDLREEFETARPSILAALCDAAAKALAAPASTSQQHPKFPDAARWAIAALPNQEQAIIQALNEIPTTPILESISTLLAKTPQWTGTASDLLLEIGVTSVTAHALSHHLRRYQNNLESRNIHVTFTRTKGARTITLEQSPPPAVPHPPEQHPPSSPHNGTKPVAHPRAPQTKGTNVEQALSPAASRLIGTLATNRQFSSGANQQPLARTESPATNRESRPPRRLALKPHLRRPPFQTSEHPPWRRPNNQLWSKLLSNPP
jgi:hypothetical protein